MNFYFGALFRHPIAFLFITASGSQVSRLGNPVTPEPRALHTAVILQKELMVVYGGIDGTESDPYKAEALNDLYVFNITSRLWYKPSTKNLPAKGDKFHAAAKNNNSHTMYVFSGLASGLFSLDTNSWEWTPPLSLPSTISKNQGATMVAARNSLIIYGGVEFGSDGTPDTSKVSDSVYTFNLASRDWILRPNGNKLYFHSACYAPGQEEELIFGGATTDGVLVSSVISLSTSAFQFYLNRPPTQKPLQLVGASLACVGSDGILMGGGDLNWKATSATVRVIGNAGGTSPVFNLSEAPIKDSGMAPGARIGHSAASLGEDIYLYGGVGTSDTNVYKLSTSTWEWEVLSPPNSPDDPTDPNSPSSNKSSAGSKNTQIIIIAIVSALFGVLMMGVIIAVFLRHWRQKSRVHKKDARSYLAASSQHPARYSAYSAENSHHDFRPAPTPPAPALRPEEEECWTVGEATSCTLLSGQDDAASLATPVRHLRSLSPLGTPRPLYDGSTSTFAPQAYPAPSEDGNSALQSISDVVSPLDRIARLHAAVGEQEAPIHPLSELPTPPTSLQNWPFLACDTPPSLRVAGVGSQLSLSSSSASLTHPGGHAGGLDATLRKRLGVKYRITASSLVMLQGQVSVVQATELSSLAPVAILVYLNRNSWEHDCEMLQLLEGPFTPRYKESFRVPSAGDPHYVLVQERLGTPLPDILRRQVQPFSDSDLRFLIKGMARVLKFCHACGIVLVNFQPADLALAPEASSSRLMLARVDSCHVEGVKLQLNAPPRYCPPELAAAFLDGAVGAVAALPSMDLWALGCLIYELYSRKPVLGGPASEFETLQRLAHGSLELAELDAIPPEASQAVRALLRGRAEERPSAANLLDLPLLARCPSHFSLLATLPQPVPPRFQNGDLDPKSAGAVVALRRQVVATSEILVPRLIVVLPTLKAGSTWADPEAWDADTFHVHFLCEGAPGMHFTGSPAQALSDPHIFLSQAGVVVAIVAQLCALYMSPEFLGGLDPSVISYLLSYGEEPEAYFVELARVLEAYCALRASVSDPAISQAARALQACRPPSRGRGADPFDAWIDRWSSSARDALTSTRHVALQEVRLFVQGRAEPHDPNLTGPTGLTYSRQLTPLSPGAPPIPQPRWHAWLCPTHAQPSAPSHAQ
ncbi:hypothetical protein L0F63_004843 [Massospora cicadina]|nr:hypothetical protein L0F63_004843 [Massospora cicadina]